MSVTDIVFFSGRIATWENSIGSIKKHVYDYLKNQGSEIITFASVHLDKDGSNRENAYEFARYLEVDTDGDRFNLETFVPSKHPIFPSLREQRYGSMYFHNWQAMNMIDKYLEEKDVDMKDVRYVIKLRADAILSADFELPVQPKEGCVFVPGSQFKGCPSDWFPDQIGASSLATMRKYCGIYPNMFSVYDINPDNTYGYGLGVCERLLYNHMKDCNVKWEFVPCVYDLNINRLEFDKYERSFQ